MLERRSFLKSSLASLTYLSGGVGRFAFADDDPKKEDPQPGSETPAAPKIEVVFCLDTTGSMGGLIDAAKQKIWAICNQIVSGKPSPDLKVGLVAYRDRGDEYITRVFDLSEDLDAIHGHLKQFRAAGGGDAPESVNEALHVAVDKIKWTKGDDVLRIIFLVGDAPPHMDYPDDVKYPVTCEKACRLGIIINTVQCGNDYECKKYWQDICKRAEGKYVQIAQDGGVVAIATPYDGRLAEINRELAKSTVTFGNRELQAAGRAKAEEARRLDAPAAADRAAFNAKKEQNAVYDLIDAIKAGKVKLEDIKKEDLPPELRDLTLEQKKEYLAKIEAKRAELQKEARELDKQRSEFIAKKQEETKGKSGFDAQVQDILRSQAKKVKVTY